ncbi:MAG: MFS transporter [Chloroflexi bacterium]|nr:MAG: MFS transporter [Chloroflexota bacterium]
MTPSSPPRWQMLLYASGSLAVALSYQAFATYIQFLYIDVFGLRAAWVGFAWSLYGLWNAVNDPLAGYLSDRTHTRWGRRIPWIAGALVPLALTFYLLWVPPAGIVAENGRSLLLYFLIIILLFDLCWTVVVMNWTALFPEMIPDEKDRATVSAWRQVFSLIGVMVGVALPPVLVGEDWSGRGQMALLLTGVTAVFFGLSLLGSRERPEFRHDEPLSLRQSLRVTLTNRDFLHFLGANLMIQYIIVALTATVPFYTKYVLKIQGNTRLMGLTLDPGTQNALFLGIAFITALPAMPVWTWAVRRWGAWQTMRANVLITAVILLGFFLPNQFSTGLLITATFGFTLAGILMLPDLLIADIIDADELTTQVRREGLYFGMNGLIIRLAFTAQGAIAGVILTLTGYLPPVGDELYPVQPTSAVFGIRFMAGGIPALAMLLASWLLNGYSLRGSRLDTIRAHVTALHNNKRARLTHNN